MTKFTLGFKNPLGNVAKNFFQLFGLFTKLIQTKQYTNLSGQKMEINWYIDVPVVSFSFVLINGCWVQPPPEDRGDFGGGHERGRRRGHQRSPPGAGHPGHRDVARLGGWGVPVLRWFFPPEKMGRTGFCS